MAKLVVIAATGGIGQQLLSQALAAGHTVTAVVRTPARLAGVPARVVGADLLSPDHDVLREALQDADAVLSGLGARTRAEAGIASRGTAALVGAMESGRVRRIVAVSAASVGTVPSPLRPTPPHHNPGDGPATRYVFAPIAKSLFGPHYADLAIMEDLLRASGLDWTVSRPPRLLDRRLRRTYRTAVDINVRGGMFISRADVARHMLTMVDDPQTFGHTIGIAY